MKVVELSGALLDYWVARAEGSTDARIEDWSSGCVWCISSHGAFEPVPFRPSTNWSQGGPLIEKHTIDLWHSGGNWYAEKRGHREYSACELTPLQAICHVVVRAAFGDEVPEKD